MYLALDIETGGIGRDKSLLTAWFGVYTKDFLLIDELDLKVKPDDGIYAVTGQALFINKIDLVEHDKIAITYKEAKTVLYKFLQKNSTPEEELIPLGHNVYFDVEFIQDKLISKGSWENFVSYRLLDTMPVARFLQDVGKLDIDGISLGNLIKHFDIKVEGNHHEAKYDAVATVEVYKALRALANQCECPK